MAIDWQARVIGPTVRVFGEPMLFASPSGDQYEANGVFDEGYQALISPGGDTPPITTKTPVCGIDDADHAEVPSQDWIVTHVKTGRVYVVREGQPDGHGHTLLILNLTQPAT